MAKTRYMIVAGASVVVVRDGKRKAIQPGGGDDFTEDEIKAVNGAVPGALRKAINETRTPSPDSDEDETEQAEKPAKVAKAPKKPAKPAKAEKPADDDDADEDGDI